VLGKLVTEPRYATLLFDQSAANRIFALTLLIACRTGLMRYCLMIFDHGTA
jgi:hypothetical protein